MAAGDMNRKRAERVFLVLGYVCVVLFLLNVIVRLGSMHVRLPGLNGFSGLWKSVLAATVFFILAWYSARHTRN